MNLTEIKRWLAECTREAKVSVAQILPSQTKEWEYSEERIAHVTGRFFQIIGIQWEERGELKQQVIIDQPEVGILGFVVAQQKAGNKVLVQAKIEPGNVNFAQIAPSCQATISNLEQVHGGSKPLFSEYFIDGDSPGTSSLQSEQGTRFYKKRNQNAVRFVPDVFPVPKEFLWIDAAMLCRVLASEYLVNTDARSVLVTTQWDTFIGREIFTSADGFTQKLKESYSSETELISLSQIRKLLAESATGISKVEVIPLSKVKAKKEEEWHLLQKGADAFRVIHVAASIEQREVTTWDQPIVDSLEHHEYTLYCGRRDTMLFFLFTVWVEPGLYSLSELGPSRSQNYRQGECLLHSSQSEEGGRFFHDTNSYSIVDVGEIAEIASGEVWLSLRQIQEYAQIDGIFTNEARSAISLLLSKV